MHPTCDQLLYSNLLLLLVVSKLIDESSINSINNSVSYMFVPYEFDFLPFIHTKTIDFIYEFFYTACCVGRFVTRDILIREGNS